ncbi:hypothetical protein [Streptomyces lichenis]|uniref:LPXTG cell wall anchor domain-containing protein n=1 Tax=Streptomyces lichenis TaxID=2306967 RepID=A0ABT0I8H0_9ACTN|nr:hypothetical protein [Streptomyces lichenis]MCK8677623.1 hypothetical protein [Streptomyces lichenis]
MGSPRTVRALARGAAALAVTAGALTATAAPASAAPQPIGTCTTSAGVVLAVDFSHWGGPVYRSCGTTPTTGFELLNQGGWRTTGTGHDGPAFICRIGYSGHQGGRQYPTSADEDCVLTPPATAYWSYWHADPGENRWEYSRLGAMAYRPKPGSVDLWIFGGTDIEGTEGRPSVTPDQLRARNTRPTGGSQPRPPAPRPADGGGQDQAARPPATRTPAATPPKKPEKPKQPEKTPAPTATPSASPSASASPSPSASVATAPKKTPTDGAKVVDAAPAAEAAHDPGSVWPVVATAALVLVLGGGAGYAARRRRRTE